MRKQKTDQNAGNFGQKHTQNSAKLPQIPEKNAILGFSGLGVATLSNVTL